MDMTKGSIVLANAGRDQDGVFFVVGEADGFVLLADGKRRRAEQPKRKRRKHVMLVAQSDAPVARKIRDSEKITNSELRRAIAAFSGGNQDQEV